MSVSREKYERAKMAIFEWSEKFTKTKDEFQSRINDFQKNEEILKSRISELEKELLEWKRTANSLPDPEDYRIQQKEIKSLKKQILEVEDRYKDKITHLERDKLLMEGKIQQLEDAKKDLQERYNDLKQDYRELTKK